MILQHSHGGKIHTLEFHNNCSIHYQSRDFHIGSGQVGVKPASRIQLAFQNQKIKKSRTAPALGLCCNTIIYITLFHWFLLLGSLLVFPVCLVFCYHTELFIGGLHFLTIKNITCNHKPYVVVLWQYWLGTTTVCILQEPRKCSFHAFVAQYWLNEN